MSQCVQNLWILGLCILHSATCHNYYVACKTPLVLSGHRGFQYQTVPGSGQVKLKRNQDVLECGSELISGESLGIDVRNTISEGLHDQIENQGTFEHRDNLTLTKSLAAGENLLEILGGATITTPGSKCSRTRALNTNVMILVSKGEVTMQV
jgi:hypothetical protein